MALRDVYETGVDEQTDKHLTATCPECSSTVIADAGERRCADCGLVITEQRPDRGPEWRSFDEDDDNPSRVGAPLTAARHDRGLSTKIGQKRDGAGSPLPGRKQVHLGRLRREHNRGRFRSTAKQNLAHACSELHRMTSGLDLPKIVAERAAAIYREAMEENLIRGRAIETIAAGSLYGACRCDGVTRTLGEIADVARCDEAKVNLGYRVLNVELGLDADVRRPRDLIPRLVSAVNASDEVERRARDLVEYAEEAGLANGRNPNGVAAASIYLAGQEVGMHVTQQALADAADVTTLTIRKRKRELAAVTD